WPDGYYMTTNQFRGGSEYAGAGNYVFERAKMLLGDPTAQDVYFSLDTALDGGMLPSDLDGTPPPAGSPNYFIEPFDGAAGALHASLASRPGTPTAQLSRTSKAPTRPVPTTGGWVAWLWTM